jgi:hypothetical protein
MWPDRTGIATDRTRGRACRRRRGGSPALLCVSRMCSPAAGRAGASEAGWSSRGLYRDQAGRAASTGRDPRAAVARVVGTAHREVRSRAVVRAALHGAAQHELRIALRVVGAGVRVDAERTVAVRQRERRHLAGPAERIQCPLERRERGRQLVEPPRARGPVAQTPSPWAAYPQEWFT